jgi:hypothetical protein
MEKCVLCNAPTNTVFNVRFAATPICERCAMSIFTQQAEWLANSNTGKLSERIEGLEKELADALDASESYKEQLQNTYLNDTQHVNREFMG